LYASVLNQIAVQENSTEANDHVNVVLNSKENLVLEILRKEPSITAEKLAERISKTEKTAKRNIASLKEKGIIEREGSDKVGSWKIIDG
jgi:ATP-dependent DNA helicase RecG